MTQLLIFRAGRLGIEEQRRQESAQQSMLLRLAREKGAGWRRWFPRSAGVGRGYDSRVKRRGAGKPRDAAHAAEQKLRLLSGIRIR